MRKSPSLISSPAAIRRLRMHQTKQQENDGNERNQFIQQHRYSIDGHDAAFFIEKSKLLVPISPKATFPRDLQSAQSSYGTQSSTLPLPTEKETPDLSHWILPALLCALAYALYNIFIKKGSSSIHPILGGVILQVVAAVIGLILLLFLTYGPAQEELFYDSHGVIFAILAGVSVGIAEIISFSVNGMGVQATQSIPIIIG